jgi:hypothetical protein
MSDDEKRPEDGADTEPTTNEGPLDDEALRKLVKMSFASAPPEDAPSPEAPLSDEPLPEDATEDVAMQSLLKKAVERSDAPVPDLVAGVQRKLRKRSRGKFYADGWSTAASRTGYAVVAVAMLLILAVAYLVLGPTGISVR